MPVIARRNRQMTLECGSHPFFIAKAATQRDPVYALIGLLKQSPRRLQPEYLKRLGWRAAGLGLVTSGEIPRAHADFLGHRFDIQALVAEIVRYPKVQFLEAGR